VTARRHTWLGAAVLATIAAVAWLSTVAISGLPWQHPYEVRIALPQGAPLLNPGDDVRIGGERAGQVQSVGLAGRGGERAVATLSLSGGFRVGPGASARVRPLGLAGAVYVDLSPGDIAHPLRSGSLIQAGAGVQITDVISTFDAATRRALQETLTGYGVGLAGHGVQLGDVIARAPGLLANLTATLDDLTAAPGALQTSIADATDLAGTVAPPGDGTLAADVTDASSVLSATGARSGSIAQTIGALPGLEQTGAAVLPSADALLHQAAGTARALAPGIAALADALPSVRSLERGSRRVLTLASIAEVAAPTLYRLAPVLAQLAGPASALTPLSDPITEVATVLIPYRTELIQAPLGFTRWGNFTYDFGGPSGDGHRAVRFSMVLTCAYARDPYPRPGEAGTDRKACP
jgi:ABC-type transporter Mla subunit MlaD